MIVIMWVFVWDFGECGVLSRGVVWVGVLDLMF